MAKKDSELTAAQPITNDDFFGISQLVGAALESRKVTIAELKSFIAGAAGKTLQAVASASTVTPASTDDVVVVSALAVNATMNAPAGTPTGQDTIVFKIKDNGTTRTLTWDAAYVWIGAAYTATTAGKWAYVTAIYNAIDGKWHLMPAQVQA